MALSLEVNSEAGTAVYDCIEVAVNRVLPKSETHDRYRSIGSVGLAILVARDSRSLCLDPFKLESLTEGLSFIRSNRFHPQRIQAWEPGDKDEEMLGGKMPWWLGRFEGFGIAKQNLLKRLGAAASSHVVDESVVLRGEFGNAGGQRIDGSLIGVSGLWEVHDHAVGRVFYHYVKQLTGQQSSPLVSPDEMANQLESVFGDIRKLHETPAAYLSREQVHELLPVVNQQIVNRFSRAA